MSEEQNVSVEETIASEVVDESVEVSAEVSEELAEVEETSPEVAPETIDPVEVEEEEIAAEPVDETPTLYKVTGSIAIKDGSGETQGFYSIGQEVTFPKSTGDEYVKNGQAEPVE